MGCLSSKLPDSNGRGCAAQPDCLAPTVKASLITDASASCRPSTSNAKLIETTNLLLSYRSNRDLFDPNSNVEPHCSAQRQPSAGHGVSARSSLRQHQLSDSSFSQSPLLATAATFPRQGLDDGETPPPTRGAGCGGGGGVASLEEHLEDEDEVQGLSTVGALPYNLTGNGPRLSLDHRRRSGGGGSGTAAASSGAEECSSGASQTLLDSVVPLLICVSREVNAAAAAAANTPRAALPAATTPQAAGTAAHIVSNTNNNPNFKLRNSQQPQIAAAAGQGGHQIPESVAVNATAAATTMTAAGLTRDSFAMNNTTGGGVCSGYMMRTVTAREEVLHTDVNWPPFQMGNPLQVRIGELLGRGGCGSAYRGEWCGRPVAVKVVQQVVTPPPGPVGATAATGGPPVLASPQPPVTPLVDYFNSSSGLTGAMASPDDAETTAAAPGGGRTAPHLPDAHASVKRLRHPNVLRTHAYAVLSMAPQLGGVLPARYEHHVVLELCDGGSLRAWLDKRHQALEGATGEGPVATPGGAGGGGHCGKTAGAAAAAGAAAVRQALERAQAHIAAGSAAAAAAQTGGAGVAASTNMNTAAAGGDGGGGGGGGLRGQLALGAAFARQAPTRFQLPFPTHHHHQEHDHQGPCHPERPPLLQPHPPARPAAGVEAPSLRPPPPQQQRCGQPGSGPGYEAVAAVQPSGLAAAALADRLVAAVTAHADDVAAATGPTCSAHDSDGGVDDVDRKSLSRRVRGLTPAQSEQLQLLGMTWMEDDLATAGQKAAPANRGSAGGGGVEGGVTGGGGGGRLASGGDAWMVMEAAAGDNSCGTVSVISDPSSRPSSRPGALVAPAVVPAAAAEAELAPLGADGGGDDGKRLAVVGDCGGGGGCEAVTDGGDAVRRGGSGDGGGGADACCELAGGSSMPHAKGEASGSELDGARTRDSEGSGSGGGDGCCVDASFNSPFGDEAGGATPQRQQQQQQQPAAAAVTGGDAAASGGLETVRCSPSPPSADLAAAWAVPTLLAYANTSVGSYGGGGSTIPRPESSSHITIQQHYVILGDPDEEYDNVDGKYGSSPMYGKPSRSASGALSSGIGSGGGGALVTFGHDLRRPDGRLQQLEEDSAEGQQSRGDATTSCATTATVATNASVSATTAGFDPSLQVRLKGAGAGAFVSGSGAGAGTGGPGSAAILAPLCTTGASDVATAAVTPGTPGLPYILGQQEPRPSQRLLTPPSAGRDAAPLGQCPWPYSRPPATATDGAGAVQAPTPSAPPAPPPMAVLPPPPAAPPLQGNLDAGPITALRNRRAVSMVNSILRAAGAMPAGGDAAAAAAATATAAAPLPPASEPMRPAQLRHLVAALECLAEIAAGLSYLHSVGMVHGDVKSGNVLLKFDPRQPRGFVLKLADFGFSRVLEHGSHTYLSKPSGTLAYLSPELLTSYRQSSAADLYAFGILVWEVVTAQPLFRGLQTPQLLYAKTHNADWQYLQWPAWCPPEVRALARRCSEYQPSARLTAAEARAQIEGLRALFQDTLARSVNGAGGTANQDRSPDGTAARPIVPCGSCTVGAVACCP